mmetsp:Transcript_9622/g.33079  ORF Transcript_9622/g.33079 Transcript_9622/m.33079 type:complete len:325 (-) Transcript_9622:411-1385(-)
MSLKTMRSGISSGANLCSTHASKTRSSAFAKDVDPPQGAARAARIFSTGDAVASRACQRGSDSKVRKRSLNAGAANVETNNPSATATSMGVPPMEPDTSTSATTLPRFGPPSPASRRARRSASIARHCAFATSSSSVDDGPRHTLLTISWGKSWAPLSFFPAVASAASRTCSRHATRSASSGNRSPVASRAFESAPPLSASLRKALRDLARQRLGTAATSSSAQRLPHILISGTSSARDSVATALRYFSRRLPSPGKSAAASLPLSAWCCLCSRGAYLAASDGFAAPARSARSRFAKTATISLRSSSARARAASRRFDASPRAS